MDKDYLATKSNYFIMNYDLSIHKITINGWFFKMNQRNNMHVYDKNMEYFDIIRICDKLDFDEFKYKCNQWLIDR